MDSLWTHLLVDGYLLTLLFVPVVLLQKRKAAVSILAWVLAIVALPYVGTLLFVVFGINRVERRAALRAASKRRIDAMLPELHQHQLMPGEVLSPQADSLVRLAERLGQHRPCVGNSVEILNDTNRTLGLIEQAIGAARESIHLEYYIWQADRTGRRVRDLLVARAREGIKVRFLFDGVGSLFLGRRFFRPMREAGIEVASAIPGPGFRERWSINLRNHRKIVIVDGQTGFTGGMNIGNEYLGRSRQTGYWRDTHLRLHGPVVLQLQQVFAEDWFFATGQALTEPKWYPAPVDTGSEQAQVIAGGPAGEVDVFHSLFFAAITEARDHISLATSYFIPTPALVSALEAAALRGVRVQILVPSMSDVPGMCTAARGYYDSLLSSGVEIHEYTRGVLHSKTLTIDGEWSLVGTPNFDTRSLLLNFECGVATLGRRSALQLEEQFAEDLRHARQIDLATFRRRGILRQLGEQTLKLFAPVL